MIMFMHMHMHVHMHMHGAEFEFKIIAIKLIRTSDVRKLSCERARAVREWRWDIAAVLAPAAVALWCCAASQALRASGHQLNLR